uniref:RNase H type-1 domain-containing protein n=1 Tax=Brassica oleracea var. oleracea TaxID=109376 RepID=A0A0D3DRE1_BRAOL
MDDRYNRNQILPRDWLSSPIQERYPTPAAYTTTIRSATAQTRYLRLEHPLEACAAMHGHIYTLLTDQSYITRTVISIFGPIDGYSSSSNDKRFKCMRRIIFHIPRTQNLKADSLARSARKQPSFVVHMDAEVPGWFAEST